MDETFGRTEMRMGCQSLKTRRKEKTWNTYDEMDYS